MSKEDASYALGADHATRRRSPASHRPAAPAPVPQCPGRLAAQQVGVERGVSDATPDAGPQAEGGPNVALTEQLLVHLCG